MAARKPLVVVNGQTEQLQAGDSLDAPTTQTDLWVATNGEASVALVIGAPVYISAADTAKRAQANALSTGIAAGLVFDTSIAAGATGSIALSGRLVATTAQWDAVTGQTGGLTFNTAYYVDPSNPGKLTATAPSTTGQVVQQVGVSLSSTEMSVLIRPSILL